MAWLKKTASENQKVLAIGEIGLDYHYPEPAKEIQQQWFRRQLNLAADIKKPVIIHSREACQDTLACMRAEHAEQIGGVIHCYSYSKEAAQEFLKMGFYFGFGDSSGEKGSLRGSILATLQKKLVVNTTGVLFELLGKTGDREAITAAGDYLGDALYQLLRQLYRQGGGNEDLFAVAPSVFDGGLVAADMQLCALRYRQALAAQEGMPELTPESLTGQPGVGQSAAQV